MTSNIPELSVSELAFSLKRTLEDTYGRVRVRGELSRVKIHTSGHLYSDLKDADAVLNIVCWKGTMARLPLKPEEGLEVICTGKISSYPGRSTYQLIVESMELAGQGALLKLLEDRRQRLAAEGLFGAERKRQLPYLPHVIGVVTSPTGAVIQDIMHRLDDRFPRQVLLWPVAVQGPGAAAQITAAIRGFDALAPGGKVPRPDLLIIARGGGSLEDLMAFNEESVVRAAAECRIPLISAVGHETDTTLIDFASDHRAPTPTAAAERAVPERAALLALAGENGQRMQQAMRRLGGDLRNRLAAQAARLADPAHLLELKTQQVDHLAHKLETSLLRIIEKHSRQLLQTEARLRHPHDRLRDAESRMTTQVNALVRAIQSTVRHAETLVRQVEKLRSPILRLNQTEEQFDLWVDRLLEAGDHVTSMRLDGLDDTVRLLEILSYKNALARGFVVVRDEGGHVIPAAENAGPGQTVSLEFQDGRRAATLDGKAKKR